MQVTDTPTAAEFMREVMQKISQADLDAIERAVAAKSALFQRTLARDALADPKPGDLQAVLRRIFSVRRRLGLLEAALSHDEMTRRVCELLYGDGETADRFQAFCDRFTQLDEGLTFDLASELLHYSDPEHYWLWTRWLYDPRTETGALRLVTTESVPLGGSSLGEIYMRVGEATAFTQATGEAAGFTRIGERAFGLDVFLASVYAIYTYTVVRMRMTQEFNKVIPELPEMVRRLLGVWENGGSHAA